MFGNRIEIRFAIETVTPLHVGSGEYGEFSHERRNDEPVSYAAVQRDAFDKPYIAATGLKGAIRSYAAGRAQDAGYEALFGKAGKKTDDARMGSLVFYGGSADVRGGPSEHLPYAKALNKAAAYVSARTAINAAAGVAADHRLFHQELIEPGTRFTLRAMLLSHASGDEVKAAKALFAALQRDGLSLGKSRADGQGQVRIKDVTFTECNINSAGDLVKGPALKIAAATDKANDAREVEAAPFTLFCPSPFLVQDASKSARRVSGQENSGPQIVAQRSGAHSPLLPGSSVSGALRQRADWIWKRKQLAEGVPQNKWSTKAVDRLFGTKDHMALLHVRRCVVSNASPYDITSVRIDRFSGGPVDNALFTTAAFTGARLDLELALMKRPGFEPDADDLALFKLLRADIEKNGLQLGAGAGKGFGWFKKEGE